MLTGKTALVSGGTGFLGREICRTLHDYGARVVFTFHRHVDEARALEAELPGSLALQLDLRHVQGINETIDRLIREGIRLDILVNNAAISQVMPLALMEAEDLDPSIDVNLRGTLFLTRAVVRGMIRNQGGAIVSMGSIAGERILAVPVSYAMTKAALTGMTRSLAAELKKFSIRVNAVVPGLLDGGVATGVPEDLRVEFLRHCCAGRAGSAREVAEVVAFLASDRASYVNGQSIQVDGGI